MSSEANTLTKTTWLHVDSVDGDSNRRVSCTGPALTLSKGKDPPRHIFLPAYSPEVIESQKTVILWFRPPQISISADQDKRRVKVVINSETNRAKFLAEMDTSQGERLKNDRGSLDNIIFRSTSGGECDYVITFTDDKKMKIKSKIGDAELEAESLDIRSGNVTIDGCISTDLRSDADATNKSKSKSSEKPKDEKKQKKGNDKTAAQAESAQGEHVNPADCIGIFEGMRLVRTMKVEWAQGKEEKVSPVVKFMQVFAFNQRSGGDASAKNGRTNQDGTEDKKQESGKSEQQPKLLERESSQMMMQRAGKVDSVWDDVLMNHDIFPSSDGPPNSEDSFSEKRSTDDLPSEPSSWLAHTGMQDSTNTSMMEDSHEQANSQGEESQELHEPIGEEGVDKEGAKDEEENTEVEIQEEVDQSGTTEEAAPQGPDEGTGQKESASAADRETEGVKKITFTQVRGLHGEQAIRHSLVGFRTAYKTKKKQQPSQTTSKGKTVKG